jgi:hypothetical protein
MDCCPCSETAEQRYARWDREASEAKAAAMTSPDTWIPQGGVEDAGDIGGDVQASTAHSRKFIRWMPSVEKWAAINDAYYHAEEEYQHDGPLINNQWTERQTEIIVCTDPSDPGSTEEWADYTYEKYYPDSKDFDGYARELAGNTTADAFDGFVDRIAAHAV